MNKRDSIMMDRVAEEIYKLNLSTNIEVAQRLGCNRKTITEWLAGRSIPNAFHLKSMYEAGMDVIYILTGKHTRGGDSDARP